MRAEWPSRRPNGQIGDPFSIDLIDSLLQYRKTGGVCTRTVATRQGEYFGSDTSGFKKSASQLDFLGVSLAQKLQT